MKIIGFNSRIHEPTVITTGNFDGVHTGHRKIIEEMKLSAREHRCKTALVTFSNHPRSYFEPEQQHQSLTTYEEKLALIGERVDYVVQVRFDKQISDLTPERFLMHLKEHFGMKHYTAGYDHHIGSKQSGNFEHLAAIGNKAGFTVDRVAEHIIGGETVSSTRIKRSLADGNIESATAMLGYRYRLTGTVIHGLMKGRQMGYPTANIECPEEKVIPARGVYAARVFLDSEQFFGMLNVGYNPTLSSLRELSTEVHILDFDREIYGKTLTVEFCSRIRDERAFSGRDDLICQLDKDKETVRNYFCS